MTVQAAATSVGVLGQHHGDVAASKHPLGVGAGRAYHARRAARVGVQAWRGGRVSACSWTTADSPAAAIAQPAQAGAAGAAAESMLGRAGVILLAVDGRGGDYRILVRSSFARYLADWLLDAVAEYAPGEP